MTKEERKERRKEKRAARRNTWKQIWQAFNIQRKEDKALLPIMIGVMVAVIVVTGLITGLAIQGNWVTWIFMMLAAIMIGITIDMFIFTRRMTNTMYEKADGQPGMAGWDLTQLKGSWRVQQTVAGNASLDVVHRVVGRPGVILVGEGNYNRLRGLMNSQKRSLARVIGDTPIYEIYVGHGDNQVEIKKLRSTIKRLPKNISREDVESINARLESLAAKKTAMGMPKGPIPSNAKLRGMQRSARRRSGR
ncbi:MAG TPA: DUF4191 domain-containing protein [Corynebacteriales bacterium]|nr:DUF4191 domain-containing protein [Mycobacteriales bacterium]